MGFNNKLKSLRIEHGYTQHELASAICTSCATIQTWERGTKKPSFDAIVSLARLFNVSADYILDIEQNDSYSQEERSLIKKFRSLDPVGKDVVFTICNIEGSRYIQKAPPRLIPKYLISPAAGFAAPFDDDEYIMIDASDAPRQADFAVEISGNSMNPYIDDGDTVFVTRTTQLKNGDVGIFCVDGSIYCKQLINKNGTIILASTNEELKQSNVTLFPDSTSSLTVYGKVLNIKAKIPSYIYEN